jgi:hypothetical protein
MKQNSVPQASMAANIFARCSRSGTRCMCEHGTNSMLRPPLWMSMTTSLIGNSTVRR